MIGLDKFCWDGVWWQQFGGSRPESSSSRNCGRCVRSPVEGAQKDVCRDILCIWVWDHAVCTSWRRGGSRTPTRRLIAEGYGYCDSGFGMLLSWKAVWRLLSDMRCWRVRAGAGPRGTLAVERSWILWCMAKSGVFCCAACKLFAVYALVSVRGSCVCPLCPLWRTTALCWLAAIISVYSGFNGFRPWRLFSWGIARLPNYLSRYYRAMSRRLHRVGVWRKRYDAATEQVYLDIIRKYGIVLVLICFDLNPIRGLLALA